MASPTVLRPGKLLWPLLAVPLLALVGLGFLLFRGTPASPVQSPAVAPSPQVVKLTSEPAPAQQPVPSTPTLARTEPPAETPLPVPAQPSVSHPPALASPDIPPRVPSAPIVSRPEPAEPQTRDRLPHLREGDRFYQEVVVSRWSACQAQGLDFRDQSRFAFLSTLQVDRATDEGLVVTQKVEAVRLDQAAADQQAGLDGLLRKARGATLQITLNPEGEVVRLEGAPEGIGAWSGLTSPEGLALSLQPSLDADAWKELARLTFFRPQGSPGTAGRWSREMTHDWGNLGRWTGRVAYRPAGKVAGLDRYDYGLDLAYRPAAAKGGNLPFAIDQADFRLVAGGGSIAYDASKGRVTAAEERFQVRGLLAVTALGLTTPLALEEVQLFQVRLLDALPERSGWSTSHPQTQPPTSARVTPSSRR